MKKVKYIIGIDEVGRGPLAGPVTVAACCIIKNFPDKKNKKEKLPPLRDSKQLSETQREAWFRAMRAAKKEGNIGYAIVSIKPAVIDAINISKAANRAATKALEKLFIQLTNKIKKNCRVLLDGGLYLNPLHSAYYLPHTKTIVKGDEKIKEVALASIIAKVTRDRMMIRLHKKHPRYGFHNHKGYGTAQHRKALRTHGPTELHRLTFIKKYNRINKT